MGSHELRTPALDSLPSIFMLGWNQSELPEPFFSGEMTSLDFFDMHLMFFGINCQYFVKFSQYLVKIHQYFKWLI